MTDVEHGTIALLRPDRTLHTLVRDPRFRWPDGLSHGGGWLYVTDSDLAHVVLKSRAPAVLRVSRRSLEVICCDELDLPAM